MLARVTPRPSFGPYCAKTCDAAAEIEDLAETERLQNVEKFAVNAAVRSARLTAAAALF